MVLKLLHIAKRKTPAGVTEKLLCLERTLKRQVFALFSSVCDIRKSKSVFLGSFQKVSNNSFQIALWRVWQTTSPSIQGKNDEDSNQPPILLRSLGGNNGTGLYQLQCIGNTGASERLSNKTGRRQVEFKFKINRQI